MLTGFLFLLLANFSFSQPNNACKNIADYNNINNDKNCFYDPDVDMTMEEIIRYHVYPVEEHIVVTEDGYILKLFRIPHGRNNSSYKSVTKQPVFFQHGVTLSSMFWVTMKEISYGFVFADQEYDVWMGNARGNVYSRAHVNLSADDPAFWNFSFHEMGIYDVRASMDYIANQTSRSDIIFIGVSLGVNMAYVYASELPELVQTRLKVIVSLCPTLFYNRSKSVLVLIAKFWRVIKIASDLLQLKEFLRSSPALKQVLKLVCLQSGLQLTFCQSVLFLIFGFDYKNFAAEKFPVFLAKNPAGTSMNTVFQILQNMDSGRFSAFDYGASTNLKIYGSSTPPDYNISRVNIPALIFYAKNDWLAPEQGPYRMYNDLSSPKSIYMIEDPNYNHLDEYFAKNVLSQIVDKFINTLKPYQKTIVN